MTHNRLQSACDGWAETSAYDRWDEFHLFRTVFSVGIWPRYPGMCLFKTLLVCYGQKSKISTASSKFIPRCDETRWTKMLARSITLVAT